MKKVYIVLEISILVAVIGIIGLWIRQGGLKNFKLQMDISAEEKKIAKTSASPKVELKEAMHYHKLGKKLVRCGLCFRRCTIKPNKRGFCGVRENKNGTLYSLVYNQPCSVNIDPIEKEPVYHFFPGTEILCVATAGCSMRCKFCQNWSISQAKPEEVSSIYLPPEDIVALAKKRNCVGVSFTYSEPTVFYEYMLEISKEAKRQGLKVIIHTCGVMNPEPLKELLKYLDAVTIDLKGFTDEFYKTAIPDGSVEHVLNTIKIVKASGVWLELVNLVIPKMNDNPEDIKRMCRWIKETLGTDVPVHFSRFFPAYRMKDFPSTPIETLEQAYKIATDTGLNYVTIGNVPGHEKNSTFCPKCKKRLIHRIHFEVVKNDVVNGKCRFCSQKIPGIW